VGLAHEGLGVGRGRDRHVAALAVRDHQEPGLPRRRRGAQQRGPARRAEALEARELGLGGDAGGSGARDQLAALIRDG
jgi:hypothetical protein